MGIKEFVGFKGLIYLGIYEIYISIILDNFYLQYLHLGIYFLHVFLNPSNVNTRCKEKYFVQPATTGRLAKSAIPYMQRLLNED